MFTASDLFFSFRRFLGLRSFLFRSLTLLFVYGINIGVLFFAATVFTMHSFFFVGLFVGLKNCVQRVDKNMTIHFNYQGCIEPGCFYFSISVDQSFLKGEIIICNSTTGSKCNLVSNANGSTENLCFVEKLW